MIIDDEAASEEALYEACIGAGCNEVLTFSQTIQRLRTMSDVEAKYMPDFDYVETVQREGMRTSWRTTMITWYHQLKDSSRMHIGTIYVAVNYMDRFLSRKSCDRLNFRLLAIGALFLATKIEEPHPIKAQDFAGLSEGIFEPADLRVMEIELLTTLQWLLHPPTTLSFVSLLARLFEASDEVVDAITERASQLVNLALFDTEFLKYRASLQAMTALICVMRDLNLPDPQVRRWLQRANCCGFDYTTSQDAESLVHDCGIRFMEKLGRLTIDDSVDDAEVEEAMDQQRDANDARGGNNNYQSYLTPAPRSHTPSTPSPATYRKVPNNSVVTSQLREPSPNDVTADVTDDSYARAAHDGCCDRKQQPGDQHSDADDASTTI